MNKMKFTGILLSLFLGLLGCSNDKDGGDGKSGKSTDKSTPVDWENLPAEFPKSIEVQDLVLEGVNEIRLTLFGFADTVEIVYGDTLRPRQGKLEIFWIAKNSLNFGSTYVSQEGKSLLVNKVGNHSCDRQIENGQLTNLEGSCILKTRIVLPIGKPFKIVNADISQNANARAVSTEEFMTDYSASQNDFSKLETIKKFLDSYAGKGGRPYIDINHFSSILVRFSEPANKMQALRTLHKFLGDRTHLGYTIDNCFATPEERKEARRIVGV